MREDAGKPGEVRISSVNLGAATVSGTTANRPCPTMTRDAPRTGGTARYGRGLWTLVMAFLGRRRRRWAEEDGNQPDPTGRLKPIDVSRIVELSGPNAERPDPDDDQSERPPEQMTAESCRWLPRLA